MEFYNDSPATSFFASESIILSGERVQDTLTYEWKFTEKILYTGFNFDDKSISISIFDDVTREYPLGPVYLKDYFTAESLLREIAMDYPEKVFPEQFLPKWAAFFKALEGSAFIHSNVTDTYDSCDQCGDYNVDVFGFLYVPAVPESGLTETSLCFHWEYGCFGGKEITGVYEDVSADVRETLGTMKQYALPKYQHSVQAALDVLEKEQIATN